MTDKTVKNGVDISECVHVTANGFCDDTLSGSCIKDNCQIYRLFKQLEKNRKLTLEYINSGTKYLKALDEIEVLIKAALDPQKTINMGQSIECLYKALDIINKTKGGEE